MCRRVIHVFPLVCVLSLMQVHMVFGITAGADPSLAAWWKLDEGAGTTVNDSSGNGNTGTLFGNPQWVSGKIGGALSSDGNGDYVNCGNGPSLSPTDMITIALWINSPGFGPNTWGAFLAKGDTGGSYRFGRNNTGNGTHFGLVGVTASGNSYFDAPTTVANNEWHYIAATYDGAQMRIYVDFVQDASLAATGKISVSSNNVMICENEAATGRSVIAIIDDVRIYSKALTAEELMIVSKGYSQPIATVTNPTSQAKDVIRDVVLGWNPGPYAKTHDVYFGTDFEDVNTATQTSPLLVSKGQDTTTYDPTGLLDFGQTYYWRIDEVNAPDKPGLYKGEIWNFTAETYGYPITTPIKATASSFSNVLTGPDKSIDGSGLNTLDQHSTSASQMWLSKSKQTPVWIMYEFNQVYSLHQMWVWNQNQLSEPDNGYGAKEVTIETSTDGTTWTPLANVPEFADAPGEDTYEHNTTVDFGGVLAKFVRLNILSNWGDARSSGLAEVRFFYVPVKAYGPTPTSGTAGVAVDGILNWRPGRTAASHEVYLGTDPNALSKAGIVTDHRFGLASAGIEYDRTYYWKVHEVNGAEVWAGDVWSFSTPGYLVVDDFESYNNDCKRIFYTWADGYGASAPECGGAPVPGNGSGSTVGNASAPYAEQTIVYGGRQSLPMAYDNASATSFSEATQTFAVGQDWVQGGIKTLVLYFRGAADNATGQLYVKINNNKVVYNGKADALTSSLWKQWNVDLATVGGNLRSVTSLAIGVSGSGKGIVYVDDIRLYRSAPAVVVPVDPGTSALSAYYLMEGDAKDSSGKGYNGTLVGDPVFVDSKAGFGKALLFDGVNDHVELPIGSLISSIESATFATWVNFDNSNANSWQRILDFGSDSTNYMFLTPRQGTTGTMRFAIRMTTSAGESGVDAPATLATGWHHVAVVIDGTAKTLQLCLDGQIVARGATLVVPKDLGVTNQNWLGRSQFSADGYFTGQLDEFRIFNRALSEGEVRYLAGDR